MDVSVICNPRFQRFTLDLAEKAGIPAQASVREGGGNNAAVIQSLLGGAPSVVMGVPVRYIHCPNCITSYQDYEHAVRLSVRMDSLIAVGSGAALLSGVVSLYRMILGAGHSDLYFESAAMILTLVTLGKMLETRSRGRTGDAIARLMELAPKTATVVRDGKEAEVPVEQIMAPMMIHFLVFLLPRSSTRASLRRLVRVPVAAHLLLESIRSTSRKETTEVSTGT